MVKAIRDKILKDRGLVSVQPARRKHHKLKPGVIPTKQTKTSMMQYLELKYNVSMEEVLLSGSLAVVAKKLGNEVDTSTISKWIKRLKLRYSATNLPDCDNCPYHRPACEIGICVLLVGMELWDLVDLKKEELINE